MLVMYLIWVLLRRPSAQSPATPGTGIGQSSSYSTPLPSVVELLQSRKRRRWLTDFVDVRTVDLNRDQIVEEEIDKADDEIRDRRVRGWRGIPWRLYYAFV